MDWNMPTNKSFEQVRQLLTTTSRGEVQSTIQNCVTVLQNDPLFAGGIRLNLLTERVDVTKPMGWSRSGSALTDTDLQYILRRMEQYGLTSDKKVRSALSIAANENRYHPIRDWLNGLVWDGRPRMRQPSTIFWVRRKPTTPRRPSGCFCWGPSAGCSSPGASLR